MAAMANRIETNAQCGDRMAARIAKLRALSWRDWKILLAGSFLLPWFWAGSRILGFPRFQAWLDHGRLVEGPTRTKEELAAIGAMISIAARYSPCPANCLTRSLLLGWLLRRRGVCSDLRIGVRLDQGELQAHAWVEYEGEPINDAVDIAQRFMPFHAPLTYKAFS